MNPSTPHSRTAAHRRLVAAFTQRLAFKGAAVLLAVILWFVVNAKEPQLELVTVRFAPELLDSSLVLRDPPPTLQALVAGSPKELIKLTSTPPMVHRQITADTPDTLIVDLHPEDVVIPAGVDAVVRDVQPRSITLRFEPTWTRRVGVSPNAISMFAPPGIGALRVAFDPDHVQISGPRHQVLSITSVTTVRATLLYPDSIPHLVDLDTLALGAGVRVRPAQVKAQLVTTPPRG